MAILVTIGTLFAHPAAKIHRSLLHRWSAMTIEDGYRKHPEPVRVATGYWWNGYSYERSREDAAFDLRWRRYAEPAYWREVRWALIAALVIAPLCSVPVVALIGTPQPVTHASPRSIALAAVLLAASAATAPLSWRVVAPLRPEGGCKPACCGAKSPRTGEATSRDDRNPRRGDPTHRTRPA